MKLRICVAGFIYLEGPIGRFELTSDIYIDSV